MMAINGHIEEYTSKMANLSLQEQQKGMIEGHHSTVLLQPLLLVVFPLLFNGPLLPLLFLFLQQIFIILAQMLPPQIYAHFCLSIFVPSSFFCHQFDHFTMATKQNKKKYLAPNVSTSARMAHKFICAIAILFQMWPISLWGLFSFLIFICHKIPLLIRFKHISCQFPQPKLRKEYFGPIAQLALLD